MTLRNLGAEFAQAAYPVGQAIDRKRFAEYWIGRALDEIEAQGRVPDGWELRQLELAISSIEVGRYPKAADCVRLALAPLDERPEALRRREKPITTSALRDRLLQVAGTTSLASHHQRPLKLTRRAEA